MPMVKDSTDGLWLIFGDLYPGGTLLRFPRLPRLCNSF